jgi:hypothetical protein
MASADVMPFIKQQYTGIVQRMAKVTILEKDRDALTDFADSIENASISKFLARDKKVWSPLLVKAHKALANELKKYEDMEDQFPRKTYKKRHIANVVEPMRKIVEDSEADLDTRKKLILDLEENRDELQSRAQ